MEFDKKVFGISFKSQDLKNVEDLFDVVREFDSYYDEPFIAVSKETFRHEFEDEDLKFSYKYAIEVQPCEGNVFYSLYLVPTFDSLCKSKQESIAEYADIEPTIEDILSYGISVLMGHEMVESTDTIDMDKVNCIASVLWSIDGLRGFNLDAYKNRIGTTGWDLLNDYILGIDAIQTTLARYK